MDVCAPGREIHPFYLFCLWLSPKDKENPIFWGSRQNRDISSNDNALEGFSLTSCFVYRTGSERNLPARKQMAKNNNRGYKYLLLLSRMKTKMLLA